MSEIPGRGNTTILLQGKLVSMYDVSGSLMPPLEPCRVVTGSKLRRMSEIPGRGNTTVLLQGKLVSVCGELLVHLPKCTNGITRCPSVRPSIINFSHFGLLLASDWLGYFELLLLNCMVEFVETLKEAKYKKRHVFVKHGCRRRQQSQNMANISKSYILTQPHPQGLVMSVKCEEHIVELTVQV